MQHVLEVAWQRQFFVNTSALIGGADNMQCVAEDFVLSNSPSSPCLDLARRGLNELPEETPECKQLEVTGLWILVIFRCRYRHVVRYPSTSSAYFLSYSISTWKATSFSVSPSPCASPAAIFAGWTCGTIASHTYQPALSISSACHRRTL